MPISKELLANLQKSGDPDALVLLQMAQHGADLQKPHCPEFAFEFQKESSALALATQLADLDYTVQIYAPTPSNPIYQVIAQRVMILDLSVLMQISEQFESLAEQHGAIYDGWGAEIVE